MFLNQFSFEENYKPNTFETSILHNDFRKNE
jgi:hypothetical protein